MSPPKAPGGAKSRPPGAQSSHHTGSQGAAAHQQTRAGTGPAAAAASGGGGGDSAATVGRQLPGGVPALLVSKGYDVLGVIGEVRLMVVLRQRHGRG